MKKPIEVFIRHCYYSKLQELPDRTRPSWFNKIKVFENFKNTLKKVKKADASSTESHTQNAPASL